MRECGTKVHQAVKVHLKSILNLNPLTVKDNLSRRKFLLTIQSIKLDNKTYKLKMQNKVHRYQSHRSDDGPAPAKLYTFIKPYITRTEYNEIIIESTHFLVTFIACRSYCKH